MSPAASDGHNTTVILDCGCAVRLSYPRLPHDIESWGWTCSEHPGKRRTKTVRRDLHTVIPL